MRWDLFCRVIDNYGDLGVCWRLAADLAARGETVRLIVDDPSPLAWMAPRGAAGVEALRWRDTPHDPGDVVIEAFGCNPDAAFVERMTTAQVWINLEYLSAEPYVERSHGLPSPQPGGLTKWFYYPGFTPHTGGLLREPRLMTERERFDRGAWLAQHGIRLRDGGRLLSLFAYPHAPIDHLLARLLADGPVHLLLTPGLPEPTPRAGLKTQRLPWLTQAGFDRLLWACDINGVRGEDSLVRALWAGAPFLWHIYPQHDGAHAAKLEALLTRLSVGSDWAALLRAWNGLGPWPDRVPGAWSASGRDDLLAQPDLSTQLLRFVAAKR